MHGLYQRVSLHIKQYIINILMTILYMWDRVLIGYVDNGGGHCIILLLTICDAQSNTTMLQKSEYDMEYQNKELL